ncbi:MAG: hypothetical protein MUC48_08930 [Leptolyngbya sp. Prado105]|nr:hypothetical protein [Leptolyngbya sp. Prado105]
MGVCNAIAFSWDGAVFGAIRILVVVSYAIEGRDRSTKVRLPMPKEVKERYLAI